MSRKVHSTIDKLPPDLKRTLVSMIVDNEWPKDFDRDDYKGNPRYEDMAAYCVLKGKKISRSAIGRFAGRLRTLTRMRQAGVITREVMEDVTDEKASKTQKAVAEMITAVAIEFISGQGDLNDKELKNLAKAMRDCTAIAINSDQYTRNQLQTKVQAATDSTKEKLTKAGVDRKLIKGIIDEHLGVVK